MRRTMPALPPRREQLLAAGLATAVLLLLARGPEVSPDSLELLAWVRCMADAGTCSGAAIWPPLWPALLIPWARGPLELAAWTLNLLLAGLTALPLYAATLRLGGRWGARAAVLAWALAAVDGDGRWWPAFACAALAPLARPEGIFLIPLVAAGALLAAQPWRRVLGAFGMACIPALTWAMASAGGRFGHELFGLSWHGIWSNADYLALTGPATAGTGFRTLVQAASQAGIESPPLDPRFVLLILPHGLTTLARGLLGCAGVVGSFGVVLGAIELGRRGLRPRLALALCLSPLLALAALPMSWGQVSAGANLMFMLPALLALAFVGWGRRLSRRLQALLTLVVVALVVELHIAPWQLDRPRYVESSIASTRMAGWLSEHPPSGGQVACTFAGRGVIRAAGLEPVTLPSSWERWEPPQPTPVLLAPDLLEDGGRGLLLLHDPAWSPAAWTGPVRGAGTGGDWYLYLVPEPST
jgi:hypothetical protein